MGAASQREPESHLEDGLRKRKEGEANAGKPSPIIIIPSSRATPLSQVFIPSQRVQNITIWLLLAITIFFTVAVVLEELQASWYRFPALTALNGQLYSAQSLDRVLKGENLERMERVELHWNVTKGTRSPDGVESNVYLVNGVFRGPIVEVWAGVVVELTLLNSLEDENVEIEFSVRAAKGTRDFWQSDPSTQSVLARAESKQVFEIRVPAAASGTFTYRAKSDIQAGGGLSGAFIVHHNAEQQGLSLTANASIYEDKVIMMSEHHPFTADRVSNSVLPVTPPSILINGIGNQNCSKLDPSLKIPCRQRTGHSQPNMQFTAGKTYRLRFINAATSSSITISIPGTMMTVIELDGGKRIQPKRATSIGVLRPGQTVDVLIEWEAGGDDEFLISLEDDTGDGGVHQSFPIRVSGFLNNRAMAPAHRYRDILRLKPIDI